MAFTCYALYSIVFFAWMPLFFVQEAVKIFTTKAHGLMYLSCLGPKGINQLIRVLSETALTASKPDVQQIAKDAAACLEAAKPPRI